MDKDTLSLISEDSDHPMESGAKADSIGIADSTIHAECTEDRQKLSENNAGASGFSANAFSEEEEKNALVRTEDAPVESDTQPDADSERDFAADNTSARNSLTEEDGAPTQNADSGQDSVVEEENSHADNPEPALQEKESKPEIPDFSEVLAALSDTRSCMDKLTAAIASVPRLDAYEKALRILEVSVAQNQRNEERLYKDLETARKGEHFTAIRPFLEFLITIHAEMLKSRREYQGAWEEFERQSNGELFKEILEFHDYYINMIQHQLNFQGVEIVSYEPDTPFSPVEQSIIRTAPTSDPSKNSMIASVETFGYRYDGKILRRARVVVYKLSSNAGK